MSARTRTMILGLFLLGLVSPLSCSEKPDRQIDNRDVSLRVEGLPRFGGFV